ncbi:SDR family NAD(P)-dependent oxidoreductase [Halobacillus trueperi]|uniref:SDR family NAD(P)-dependent oxidoreductase n=1 Tax=Halobacillus trueperi TaxID=156205 RepID=UPI003736B3D7
MTKQNETVLITGVAQGIGRGLAIAYAEKGYRVIGCDVNAEKGRKTMEGMGLFLHCDVSDPKQVETLFHKINESFSILINNVGVSDFKSMFELDVDEWDRVLNTNLRSCFLFSKYAAERWKKDETSGRIVNMASTRAFMSEPDSEAYAASKGGIFALTHAMAASLSPYNIRVNSISPGWIHAGDPDELRDKDHDQHLSNRVGTVDDIAKACFYLTDEENSFVNGENVTVDGGMTRKMIYEH